MYRLPFSVRFGPLPAQSFQPSHRPSLIPSGIAQHHPQMAASAHTVPAHQQSLVDAMGERHTERRRPDNTQHPSRRNLEYQNMVQAHAGIQADWYGISSQQTNATMSPLSRPVDVYSMAHSTSTPTYYPHTDPPTQCPSMDAVPFCIAPPQQTSGGDYQGQGQDGHSLGPTAYHHAAGMQPDQGGLYTAPGIPTEAFPLISDPPYHVLPHLRQVNWMNPNGTSINSAAGPEGSGCDMSTSDDLKSCYHQIWFNTSERTAEGQKLQPPPHPSGTAARKARGVGYEGDLVRLQQRCRGQGADDGAVALLARVFAHEVSLEALTRPFTDADVETEGFGVRTGKVYLVFLEYTNEEEHVVPRYACRLCHGDQTWKHSKDVLRHLRRDHFGLYEACKKWCVSNRSLTLSQALMCFPKYSGEKYYTKSELTRHFCRGIKRTRVACLA